MSLLRPVLKFAYRKTLIIEVNSWFSQQVMAYAFAILAHELLGYEVVFNHVENTGARGVYRRAAGIPNEGEKGKSRRAAAGRAQLLAKRGPTGQMQIPAELVPITDASGF